jgi:hypothetical protein
MKWLLPFLAGCITFDRTSANSLTLYGVQTLTYSENPARYTVGAPIKQNVPRVNSGTLSSYFSEPALPAGLTLDANSGIIHGTPTEVSPESTYSISAAGDTVGGASFDLIITIDASGATADTGLSGNTGATGSTNVDIGAPLTSVTYSPNPVTYFTGSAITPIMPSVNGGTCLL